MDPNVKAIITGSTDYFDFRKLAIASMYLSDEEIKFVTTNDDPVCIAGLKNQRVIPDIGAILGAIETASGRKALAVGKP